MPTLAEDLKAFAEKCQTHGLPVTAEEMDAFTGRAEELERLRVAVTPLIRWVIWTTDNRDYSKS